MSLCPYLRPLCPFWRLIGYQRRACADYAEEEEQDKSEIYRGYQCRVIGFREDGGSDADGEYEGCERHRDHHARYPHCAQNAGCHARRSVFDAVTGDPKIALIKLSIPLIAAMMLMSVYNLIDAVWVAGLGSDALAAVGFTVPLIIMVLGLGTGIGAGVNSLLSRLIGAGERVRADNAAMHSFILTAAVAVLITVPGLIFLKPILLALGAGSTIDLAFTYAQILFTGTVMFLSSRPQVSVHSSLSDPSMQCFT